MNDLIHIRLDSVTKNVIERRVQEHHFSSTSEFVKDALRKQLEYYEKLEALSSLKESIQGSHLSRKERAEAVKKGLSSSRTILKEFDLE